MASKPSATPTTEAAAKATPKPAAKPAAKPATKGTNGGLGTVPGTKTTRIQEEMAEREEVGSFNLWLRNFLRQTPSWLVSMVVHMIVLLALAVWWLDPQGDTGQQQLVVAPGENEEPLEDIEEFEEEFEEIDVSTDMTTFESPVQEQLEVSPADDMEAAAIAVELTDFGLEHAPRNDLLATIGSYTGTGLSGRGSGSRGGLVAKYGGSAGSEKAVALALKWLSEHQMPDGGWSFDHRMSPMCGGQCRNPGNIPAARNGATALALLPFLGAGQTHKTGKYKDVVNRGLYFLGNRMKPNKGGGGSFWEDGGRMYSHGLASIALCEAYAMTHDKDLHIPAQAAVDFICYAQDPVGGGWRYQPREKGDTSVVGWQIMALKSGHMAYLRVPPITVKKAFGFFDFVQSKSGAAYGYTGPGEGHACTAIGLLCRMYLGWKKDNPALQRGAEMISSWGPSNDMYYNYYATQVMRHMEGDMWKKWNDVMRDQLVDSQAKAGHETGSWFIQGGHGPDRGGRLYVTAMATMILEVYYRHLPIYRKQSTEEDFPE